MAHTAECGAKCCAVLTRCSEIQPANLGRVLCDVTACPMGGNLKTTTKPILSIYLPIYRAFDKSLKHRSGNKFLAGAGLTRRVLKKVM